MTHSVQPPSFLERSVIADSRGDPRSRTGGHGRRAVAVSFTVAVDGSGTVTLDQQRALVHADPSNPNEADTIGSNLISLQATVTDGDGDHASAALDLGSKLSFLDDAPSISLSGETPALTVDESNLAVNASASFAGAFTAAFGADGPAASNPTSYALSISASGADSGLVDTASGNHVFLFLEGGQIVVPEGAWRAMLGY